MTFQWIILWTNLHSVGSILSKKSSEDFFWLSLYLGIYIYLSIILPALSDHGFVQCTDVAADVAADVVAVAADVADDVAADGVDYTNG